MAGYLINFSVYTIAMVGLIFIALYTFKTFSVKGFGKKSALIKIEDATNLNARKTLYIVNAQNERFLIASDVDRTTLIAKLNDKNEQTKQREDKSSYLKSFDGIDSLDEFASVIDFQKEKAKKGPVMKELAKKLSML